MAEPDQALLEIFQEETDERLERIVQVLLCVESGDAGADAVAGLFRDLHSIKGNAGMVGFEELRAIAHAMEDALAESRERGVIPPALVEPLLRATDAMRRVLEGHSGASEAVLAELAAPAPQEPEGASQGPASERARRSRSIRVSAEKVDVLLDAVGEAALQQRRIEHLANEANGRSTQDLPEELDRNARLMEELQDSVLSLRTLPLSSITGRFPRAVRDLARQEGKEVELVISGADTQLDRLILDGISETISHLLTNAVVHGIEPPDERVACGKPAAGTIRLRAEQRGAMVAIEVSDDGRGITRELQREAARRGSLTDLLADAGFSTAGEVTSAAGRGVGLNAVKSSVEALGGSLEVTSEPGAGTSSTLLLPLTLALLRVLLFERGGQVFGLPLASVEQALTVQSQTTLAGRAAIELGGKSVPVADLAESIGAAAPPLRERPPAIVLTARGERVAAFCDAVVGEQAVVVKTLGTVLEGIPGYLGAAILGDGALALILDPAELAARLSAGRPAMHAGTNGGQRQANVLVVDDQFTVRELQRSILEAAGYAVQTANDGTEALNAIERNGDIDLVVTDLEMPNLDGLGLLALIRSDHERAQLPVVVVTSKGTEEDRRRGLEAGADAYIVKHEFDQQALLETVARLVGQ